MSLKPKIVDFGKTWTDLQVTVQGVITLGDVSRDVWNARFSDVYSLCVAYPEPLANRLYFETKELIEKHVQELMEKIVALGEENLLKNYHQEWDRFSMGIGYLHRLYLYLNLQHIRKEKVSEAETLYGNLSPNELLEMDELGLSIWKRKMIEPLKDTLVKLLMEGITQDRYGQGDPSIASIIHGVIQSLILIEHKKAARNLAFYQEVFEGPYLDASGEFFKREATRLLSECGISEYMERVIKFVDEESYRSHKFLHFSSMAKVRVRCELHMVSEHLPYLHSECKAMVEQERRKDLSLMYSMLRSVPGAINVLINHLFEHIKGQGLEAVRELKGDNVHVQFVESVLAIHKKYNELIQVAFQGDKCFVGALDKACQTVVNHTECKVAVRDKYADAFFVPICVPPGIDEAIKICRSAELLAKYCDTYLRKSNKAVNESDVEDRLAQSITIFKYIDDKDVFLRFYSRLLAKRLINQMSQAMDSEEAMINRLKLACGYQFTSKLHRMFTDISLSSDLNKKFNDLVKGDAGDLGINFSINVLQAGAWPLGQSQSLITSFAVPQELEKSVQKFENYYHEHFNGRKLTWLHHLCQGELKLGYLNKPYKITMQTFQMAILLLFEKVNSLAYEEVQTSLQLNTDQFNKNVASLIEAKLLTADGEPLGPQVQLQLNLEYSNKRTKIRITAGLQRDTPLEVERAFCEIDEDRKLCLQAAIVRIMKSRKLLRHNELIQEVLSQSKVTFAPAISMIKKCIEALIEKEYIKRTANSTDQYSYVA